MSNNNQNRDYCVYKHTNIFNNKVYIGITKQDPKVRWANGRGYIQNEYFWRSIQKYGWDDGFTHEILFYRLTEEEACQKEIELIELYNSTNSKYGYNHNGGGKSISEETIMKIKSNHSNNKAVRQYSIDGHFIAEYISGAEAGRTIGTASSNISNACNGKTHILRDSFWCYVGNENKIQEDIKKYRSTLKHIYQYDLSGNLVCEYQNIYDAADKTSFSHQEIFDAYFNIPIKPLNGFLFCDQGNEGRVKRWVEKQNKKSQCSKEEKHKQYLQELEELIRIITV